MRPRQRVGAGNSVLHMLAGFVLTPFTLLDGVVLQLAGLLLHLVMLFVASMLRTFSAFVFSFSFAFSTLALRAFVFRVAPHFMMLI